MSSSAASTSWARMGRRFYRVWAPVRRHTTEIARDHDLAERPRDELLQRALIGLFRQFPVGAQTSGKEVCRMPSKIFSERPFRLLRVVGWWAATIILAYILGYEHVDLSGIGIHVALNRLPPTTTAPPQH